MIYHPNFCYAIKTSTPSYKTFEPLLFTQSFYTEKKTLNISLQLMCIIPCIAAYMFASARKRHFNELENDQVEKQSDSEIITEIPSTIMVDTTGIVTENVLEDQQQEPNQGVVSGWREKLGFSRKMN